MNALDDGNYVGVPRKVESTGESFQTKRGSTLYKWNITIEINGIEHDGTCNTTKPDKCPFKVGEETPVIVNTYNDNMVFKFDYDSAKKGGGSFKSSDDSFYRCNAMNNAINLVIGDKVEIGKLEETFDRLLKIVKP